MMSKKYLAGSFCVTIFCAGLAMLNVAITQDELSSKIPQNIVSVDDALKFFRFDTYQIDFCMKRALDQAQEALQNILSIPSELRTFENTVRALDQLNAHLGVIGAAAHTLSMVSPKEDIRQAAQKAMLELEAFAIEHLSQNRDLYKSMTDYHAHSFIQENLSDEQKYYVNELLRDMKRSGLELPEEVQASIKKIKRELADVCNSFDVAINADQRSIHVSGEELSGISDEFLNQLPRVGEQYVVGTDTPTYVHVMEHCSVASTRKALYLEYVNRAHPQNSEALKKIIALRHHLSELLGYRSYAHLMIEDSMAKSVDQVETFLNSLIERLAVKVDVEMAELRADLPEDIALTEAGQFNPWDLSYIKAKYKKKHLQLDERHVAEYFPIEKTIPALLGIYQEFLNISFEETPIAELWHPDVRAVAVREQGRLRGYLLLDLHPRSFKYTHACEIGIVKAQKDMPALAVVLANFPQSTPSQPALLKHADVVTFFHEFGHAIHELLSATEMIGFAGTAVKRDFVEMPSQMLEEWIWDTDMLKRVSSHHQSGEPLSDTLIDCIRAVKNFCVGDATQRQLSFARLSLECFKPGAEKDPHALKQAINQKLRPYIYCSPEDHFEASFGHLNGYGPLYYGYLWSKVYALDLFGHIKQHGIVNPAIGCKYAVEILGKGGSIDPEILLSNFLGRQPQSDAFFKDLGV